MKCLNEMKLNGMSLFNAGPPIVRPIRGTECFRKGTEGEIRSHTMLVLNLVSDRPKSKHGPSTLQRDVLSVKICLKTLSILTQSRLQDRD